jgi:hypothetical protein
VWTFSDIQDGDYVSFLYGARVHNLYRVGIKEAIRNAQTLPPWQTITFKMSGLTYYFPFRLKLVPVRKLSESLVRAEFSYVAENLLLRGGYRKTHFQADQTTLQSISQLGQLYSEPVEKLDYGSYETFVPCFTKFKDEVSTPEVFRFVELILQRVMRQYLSDVDNLSTLLGQIGTVPFEASKLEVMGEKALPEGHIDLLIKEANPIGLARKIVIEVKTGLAKIQDINQLKMYQNEMGSECLAGVLIARGFSRRVLQEARAQGVKTVEYGLNTLEVNPFVPFEELKKSLCLNPVP